MQGLADGYFVIPYTIGDYLAGTSTEKISTDRPEFKEAMDRVKGTIDKLLSIKGKKSVDQLHKELGHTMWEYCGMARNDAGLRKAKAKIQEIKKEFWSNVNILGSNNELNQELEKAMREPISSSLAN